MLFAPQSDAFCANLVTFGKLLGSSRVLALASHKMPNLTDFLRIAEAADYLGVCQNTLRNWGKLGKIREYRHPVNNYRLFLKSELDAFVERVLEPETKSTVTLEPFCQMELAHLGHF